MHEETGLTRNQFFIWLGQESSPELPVFNELTVFSLDGELDRSSFDQAFQAVVDETDALRTVVRRDGRLPRAEVLDRLTYASSFIDLSVERDPAEALDRWARAHVDVMVDLSQRPFESTLLKLSPTRYAWALLQHHILSDATSMTIVFRRVGDHYARLTSGEPNASLQSPAYSDYVEAEAEYSKSDRYAECKAFWEAKIEHPPDPVTFYGGRSLSAEHGLRRERLEHPLGAQRSEAIRQFARRDGVRFLSDDLSIFSVFAAAMYAYLFRLCGQETLAIGAPWQNRPRQYGDTVGLLMEQDPFIVSLDAHDTFESLIRKIHDEALSVMRHLPYAAGNPGTRVYDVGLNYLKVSLGDFAGIPVQPNWYRPSHGDGSMLLQVHDLGGSGELSLSFDFNAELFAPSHRHAAVSHFMNCLTACLDDPSQEIGSVSLLTEDERGLLFGEWNATVQEYPSDRTVVELFETQVGRRPTAVAARCGDDTLSYGALDGRATALAHHLRGLGVKPGVLVGVCLERSLDMLVGLLGILKAGGAYVPLDPAFPPDRLAFMLADSETPILVTETALLDTVDPGESHIVCLDELALDESAGDDEPRSGPRAAPDDLAYVLYTSGSTGQPKGVEISHRALTNFLCSMGAEPGCSEDDVLLAITTLSFDIAGLELFLPLIVGGQVEVASRSVAADGRLLRARLDAGGVTVLQATPVTWRMLLDAGWSGTAGLKALIGGEALPPDLVQPLLDRTASLWNMYGPTETTIWSSVQRMATAGAEITIGTPIANTTFYILDRQQQPVPVGVAGELFIGGDGLADGYHARPELTAERFLADPFDPTPGARMYRTGDLARYRADGQVVHLGRLDHQVKIRGFRIELGEIEAALGAHPSVQQSIVVALDDQRGASRLVAYCVPGAEGMPTPALREHLRRTLPDYMVPQQFVELDAMPLTPNGKIDRNRLPVPDIAHATPTDIVAPRTRVEARVAALFSEVLPIPAVDIHADFFDLGGQSLLAVRLLSRLEDEFHVQLPLHVLFEASTVAQLSDLICDATGAERAVASAGTDADGPRRDARAATERRLVDIWTAVLGATTLSSNDSFIELQGSRALIAPMLARVRDEFGVIAEGISAVEFEAEPTIAGLARIIEASTATPPTFVVPLQPKGDQQPLFLVHAGGGYVFFYRALAARLGHDRPVYGIRAVTRDDDNGRPFDQSRSVEELAAQYIEGIRTIQSRGPYNLGGACLGGVVAFEMARQLLAAGESLASPILLFDSFLREPDREFPEPEAGFKGHALSRIADHLGPTERPDGRPTVRYVLQKGIRNPRRMLSLVPAATRALVWHMKRIPLLEHIFWRVQQFRSRWASYERVQMQTMEHFLEVSWHLVNRFNPAPYPGSGVLFKGEEGDDPEPGWSHMFLGGLTVHVLPGVHLDMMEEPVVMETATLLRQHLDVERLDVDRSSELGVGAGRSYHVTS